MFRARSKILVRTASFLREQPAATERVVDSASRLRASRRVGDGDTANRFALVRAGDFADRNAIARGVSTATRRAPNDFGRRAAGDRDFARHGGRRVRVVGVARAPLRRRAADGRRAPRDGRLRGGRARGGGDVVHGVATRLAAVHGGVLAISRRSGACAARRRTNVDGANPRFVAVAGAAGVGRGLSS